MPEFETAFFEHTLEDGKWANGRRPSAVLGFNNDTRALQPGECFVAITTEKRDGHDYLEQAQRSGAAMALVSRITEAKELPQFVVPDTLEALRRLACVHRQVSDCPLVGITGTVGKTSTKDMIALLLGTDAWKTPGNLNNTLGVPLTLLKIEPGHHTEAVIEAGINQGHEMDLLSEMILPDVGIVTNVGPGHLDQLGSVEGVAREKVRLLQAVPSDGLALFPHTCLKYPEFLTLESRVWVTSPMGLELDLPSGYEQICYETETRSKLHSGTRLSIAGPANFIFDYSLPPMSEGMVSNTVIAILAAQECGASQSDIEERLRGWTPSNNRGQWIKVGTKQVYADSYNANPVSMLDALKYFDACSHINSGRLFILATMNELGSETESIHREVGSRIPVGPLDRVVLVGPKSERMRAGLESRITLPKQIIEVESAEDALDLFRTFSGDVFLKGSRAYRLGDLVNILMEQEVLQC